MMLEVVAAAGIYIPKVKEAHKFAPTRHSGSFWSGNFHMSSKDKINFKSCLYNSREDKLNTEITQMFFYPFDIKLRPL